MSLTFTPVVSDDFERSDGSIGANWYYCRPTYWQGNPPYISSGKVHGRSTAHDFQVATWAGGETFSPDQYVTIVISGLGWFTSDYMVGVALRTTGIDGSIEGYFIQVLLDNGGTYTTKLVILLDNAGPYTMLDLGAVAWTDGDELTYAVKGSTFYLYKNGTLLGSVDDMNYTDGMPGILVAGTYADTDKALIDSFVAGNVTEGGSAFPAFPGHIADIGATQSLAISSVDVSGEFTDDGTLTFTKSTGGTAWPAGFAIDSVTGHVTGSSAVVANTTGCKVTATDEDSQAIDSNAFAFNVVAPATPSTARPRIFLIN